MAKIDYSEVWFLLLLQMQEEKEICDLRQKDDNNKHHFVNMVCLIMEERLNNPSSFLITFYI